MTQEEVQQEREAEWRQEDNAVEQKVDLEWQSLECYYDNSRGV